LIIDTHIHLDSERFDEDLDDMLLRAKDNNVSKFIIPASDPNDLKKAINICKSNDNIYYAKGVHPIYANMYDSSIFDNLENAIAIGECGLDYFHLKDEDDKKLQKEIFIKQIKIANESKLPLIIHIRDSSEDSKEILLKYSKYGGVLHCFNGDDTLLELSEIGFYFGIGGVSTFKNAKKLQEIIPKIPKSRLILETDAPYLAPHPNRGKRNEPSFLPLVVNKLVDILNMEYDEICDMTSKNSMTLFSI